MWNLQTMARLQAEAEAREKEQRERAQRIRESCEKLCREIPEPPAEPETELLEVA